ncbi:MAG: anaerobic ribonucleoside-triphosphate reductase activating protein [Bacillota bacterium]
MKVAGIQKTSLIDYPGKIVTTLFTVGCNLRCRYCHNPELIERNRDSELNNFALDEVLSFLDSRVDLIDGVCITGGEPTLQPDLDQFMRQIKKLGLKIKLDTNGSNPQLLAELLTEQLVDYIALDLKAAESNLDVIGAEDSAAYFRQVKESVELILAAEIETEFRTTVVPGVHTSEDIQELAALISGADKYYLQNFKPNAPLLDAELEQINGFSEQELSQFQDIATSYVGQVEIRD